MHVPLMVVLVSKVKQEKKKKCACIHLYRTSVRGNGEHHEMNKMESDAFRTAKKLNFVNLCSCGFTSEMDCLVTVP